jgi:hypothetical protein
LGSTFREFGQHIWEAFLHKVWQQLLWQLAGQSRQVPAKLHRPVSASVGLSDWVAGLDDLFGLLSWLVELVWLAGLAKMAAMAQTSLHCFGRRANFWLKQIYLRWPTSQQAMA